MQKSLCSALPAALMAAALLLALCACAPPLPGGMDADTVTAAAQAAIDRANARDYEGLVAMMRGDLQESTIPVEDWAAALDPVLDEAGAFVSYAGSAAVGQNQNGVESALVVVQARYENRTLTYTVAFDAGSEMTGFWVR